VFICYAREDEKLASQVFEHLKQQNNDTSDQEQTAGSLDPIMDRGFLPGRPFREQIQRSIAHAHLFVPVVTPASTEKGWVHQEIGFATAHNIPVLPVCEGHLPKGMIEEFQCLRWEGGQGPVADFLCWKYIDDLVQSARENSRPMYECAELHVQRTMMMVEYAHGVLTLDRQGMVRQKGALSSFHIPDKPTSDPAWEARYGDRPKEEYLCRLLRRERQLLTEHARAKGFSIIIDPSLPYEDYGSEARKARLMSLLEFLHSVRGWEVPTKVALQSALPEEHNVTIVGDWFLAEAVSASIGKGYQQTIFTRHAPTILTRIEAFDEELNSILNQQGIPAESSLDKAITELEEIIAKI
jgi:hypothetical protein